MKTTEREYSWINFKIDKKIHTKFSMILKLTDRGIRDVMTQLVSQYVQEHRDEIVAILADPEQQSPK